MPPKPPAKKKPTQEKGTMSTYREPAVSSTASESERQTSESPTSSEVETKVWSISSGSTLQSPSSKCKFDIELMNTKFMIKSKLCLET